MVNWLLSTSIFLSCIQTHFLNFIKAIFLQKNLQSVFSLKTKEKKSKHLPSELGWSVYFISK